MGLEADLQHPNCREAVGLGISQAEGAALTGPGAVTPWSGPGTGVGAAARKDSQGCAEAGL